MTKIVKTLLVLVSASVFAVPTYADGIRYTANVTFEYATYALASTDPPPNYVNFQASYELDNIGAPPVCGDNPIFEGCSGGDWVLNGPLVFSVTSSLGPFVETYNGPAENFFDFDSSDAQIQIEFELEPGLWMRPGDYGAFNVNMTISPEISPSGFSNTGTGYFVGVAVPEPKTTVLLAIGVIGLLLCASFMKPRLRQNQKVAAR